MLGEVPKCARFFRLVNEESERFTLVVDGLRDSRVEVRGVAKMDEGVAALVDWRWENLVPGRAHLAGGETAEKVSEIADEEI